MLVIFLYMSMQKKGHVPPLGALKTGFAPKMEKNCEVGENPQHCSLILKMFGGLHPEEHSTSAGRLSSCKLQPEQEDVCQVPQESLS